MIACYLADGCPGLHQHRELVKPTRTWPCGRADPLTYPVEHVRLPNEVVRIGLTAFRWRGRPSPFPVPTVPSRTILAVVTDKLRTRSVEKLGRGSDILEAVTANLRSGNRPLPKGAGQ